MQENQLSRECRLSPIASGTSLVTLGSQSMVECASELRRGGRGGSIRGSSGALFAEDGGDRTGGSTTPVIPGSGVVTSQPLSTQSYFTLRSITNHRRVVSESTHEERTTRNSLKGFLSSSYEHGGQFMMPNLLEVQGLVRSPSGCSEVSSVRSGVRGIGLGPSSSSRALGSYNPSGAMLHHAGQCYIGFALPLDLDLLLYDASMDKKAGQGEGGGSAAATTAANSTPGKDRFPAITESELHYSLLRWQPQDEGRRWEDPQRREGRDRPGAAHPTHLPGLLHPHPALAPAHTLGSRSVWQAPLYSFPGQGEGEASETALMVESPPLQRVKAISETSEASDTGSFTSQGWEDTGEIKGGPERVNQTLFRKEVLRFITNLLSSIAAKSSESGLLTLKQRWPEGFKDVCLYSEICLVLASYNYRLTARRFIQELFMDLVFREVYAEASAILKHQFEGLCETMNPAVQELPSTKICSSLQPPSMADIAEVSLSDKSDREEDC